MKKYLFIFSEIELEVIQTALDQASEDNRFGIHKLLRRLRYCESMQGRPDHWLISTISQIDLYIRTGGLRMPFLIELVMVILRSMATPKQ